MHGRKGALSADVTVCHLSSDWGASEAILIYLGHCVFVILGRIW